jgi:hypothetical protein
MCCTTKPWEGSTNDKVDFGRVLALAATGASAQYYGTGSNPNSHPVHGHVTSTGTYVPPHQQTNPNSTQRDNVLKPASPGLEK